MERMMTCLKLARIREVYPDWIKRAAEEEMSYSDFLRGLLEEEICAREDNSLNRRRRAAGFPFEKGIEQFDFNFRPELKKQVILSYLSASFVEQGHSLVLIGAAGLGKTHLAIGIGLKMIQLGYSVRFITSQELLNRYSVARSIQDKEKYLKPLIRCDLLILDELGYLPCTADAAPAFYQLIAGRYEKRATIITTNKSLNEWGTVMHDSALAAAIIDRILHHGDVFLLKGDSYRLRKKKNKKGTR